MTTKFDVECKLNKWEWVRTCRTLKACYEYIVTRKSHNHPYRVVRVVRTIVFEETD